jgi:hypothetical protein
MLSEGAETIQEERVGARKKEKYVHQLKNRVPAYIFLALPAFRHQDGRHAVADAPFPTSSHLGPALLRTRNSPFPNRSPSGARLATTQLLNSPMPQVPSPSTFVFTLEFCPTPETEAVVRRLLAEPGLNAHLSKLDDKVKMTCAVKTDNVSQALELLAELILEQIHNSLTGYGEVSDIDCGSPIQSTNCTAAEIVELLVYLDFDAAQEAAAALCTDLIHHHLSDVIVSAHLRMIVIRTSDIEAERKVIHSCLREVFGDEHVGHYASVWGEPVGASGLRRFGCSYFYKP